MTNHLPAVIDTLKTLVGFDTVSHSSNLDAIGYLRERLEQAGATCRMTFDDDRRKANLYATLGPKDRPGLMLSGHTDTVPVDASEWTGDPFSLAERDGKLYGRGAADMKAFIALAITLAPDMVRQGLRLPIHFSFSYDEELGCVGVRRLIDDMAGLEIKPALCLVGEPTGLKVVAGHKGKRSLTCHVHGRESHSALVSGVNAIEAAARLIAHIADLQSRIREQGPFDSRFDPPYTTLQTGLIGGGKALNITPGECRFEYEIRALPDHDPDILADEITSYARNRIEPAMKAKDQSSGFAFATMNDTAGFNLADDHPLVTLVGGLTGDNAPQRVSFGTEAGLFNRAGVPTLVCGPGYITDAHKADEFIAIEQIAKGAVFLQGLIETVCG
jgi:acetylornithine deacetylase